jgi:hypothetical protein
LGKFRTWLEDATGSAGRFADRIEDPMERGLFDPEGKEYRPPPQSKYANKIFGYRKDRTPKKKKSPISICLKPIA